MVTNYDFLVDAVNPQDTEHNLYGWKLFTGQLMLQGNTNPSERKGKFLMDSLEQAYPDLAKDFKNTACDPTHREEIVPIFLDVVERAWKSRIRYANHINCTNNYCTVKRMGISHSDECRED